ncbi:uncharacterized protein [Parasteatoda tepidariorum]|uniref:uncharacterized protein isoform X2 n=1 Tax=Parasteatoda tepidariorum TaxID=114398 RepID=UPI00077FDB34|nr:uncharacterized protein LOC107451742 isoform X2 [Parasteatoda tepidariorum]
MLFKFMPLNYLISSIMSLLTNQNQQTILSDQTEGEDSSVWKKSPETNDEHDNPSETENKDTVPSPISHEQISEIVFDRLMIKARKSRLIAQKRENYLAYCVWNGFISLHIFLVPCLAGLAIVITMLFQNGEVCLDLDLKEWKQSTAIALFGLALVVGLPFHLLALTRLENAIYDTEIQEIDDDLSDDDLIILDSDQYEDEESSTSLAEGDNIEKGPTWML